MNLWFFNPHERLEDCLEVAAFWLSAAERSGHVMNCKQL